MAVNLSPRVIPSFPFRLRQIPPAAPHGVRRAPLVTGTLHWHHWPYAFTRAAPNYTRANELRAPTSAGLASFFQIAHPARPSVRLRMGSFFRSCPRPQPSRTRRPPRRHPAPLGLASFFQIARAASQRPPTAALSAASRHSIHGFVFSDSPTASAPSAPASPRPASGTGQYSASSTPADRTRSRTSGPPRPSRQTGRSPH